jgi:hypothetical protein
MAPVAMASAAAGARESAKSSARSVCSGARRFRGGLRARARARAAHEAGGMKPCGSFVWKLRVEASCGSFVWKLRADPEQRRVRAEPRGGAGTFSSPQPAIPNEPRRARSDAPPSLRPGRARFRTASGTGGNGSNRACRGGGVAPNPRARARRRGGRGRLSRCRLLRWRIWRLGSRGGLKASLPAARAGARARARRLAVRLLLPPRLRKAAAAAAVSGGQARKSAGRPLLVLARK